MNKEMIFDIIDDIAAQAKVIICAHLQKHEFTEALKQSAKDWEEVCEKTRKLFLDLEDDIRAYYDKNRINFTSCDNYAEDSDCTEFCIGDEIVFIGNGCAVNDRISRILVETEMGYMVYAEDAFGTMDELVEHLKENVHG